MEVRLKETQPMFLKEPYENPIWIDTKEVLDVVEIKVMRHDGKEWYKVKSRFCDVPFAGFSNPDSFVKVSDDE